MGPQGPKDVTRDTARDLSGLVVVAVGLRYSGGVHSVPPFLWAGSRGTSTPAGPYSSFQGTAYDAPGHIKKASKIKYYSRQRIKKRSVDNLEQDA